MKLFVDTRGTLALMQGFSPMGVDTTLARAICSFWDLVVGDDDDEEGELEIVVWSWLEDEAAKFSELAFGHNTVPYSSQKKEYGTSGPGDIIVDDKPQEWKDYAQGAEILTPAQFVARVYQMEEESRHAREEQA